MDIINDSSWETNYWIELFETGMSWQMAEILVKLRNIKFRCFWDSYL